MKKLFTLFSAAFMTTAAFAQMPNPGFETWTTAGSGSYDQADGWGSINGTIDGVVPGTYTCEKGTSGAPAGTAFMMLTSKNVATIVAPGIAVTGTIAVDLIAMTFDISGGFPYTTRSANLTGKWQHMPTGADHGRIIVFFSKWNMTTNSRDTVAIADTTLTGMAMTWSDFTIPLTYKSVMSPDSAMVALMSSEDPSAPIAGSYLYVDDLAFSGTVPTGVISLPTADANVTVFPNPASGSATVYFHSNARREVTINLTDITGKVVKTAEMKAIAGENSHTIELKGVAQGMYFVQIADENSVVQKKLIVE